MASSVTNDDIFDEESVRFLLARASDWVRRRTSSDTKRDPHDPDTFAHDAFFKLQKHVLDKKTIQRPAAWLQKTAWRLFIDHIRQERRKHAQPIEDVMEIRDQEALYEFLRSSRNRRLSGELKERIKHLSPTTRKVFAILECHSGDKKTASKYIADNFFRLFGEKISESTVHRCREELRQTLRECLRD